MARAPARKAPARKAPPKPVRLPMRPGTLKRVLGWVFGLGGTVAAVVALFAAGLPQRALFDTATWAARMGFAVRQVEIRGDVNQPRLSIYRETLAGATDSMLLTDLPEIRERVRALPWVADASVARRWPDTIAIEIVEKRPIALWQYRQQLRVIDSQGNVLPSDDLNRFASLPIVVGGTANRHAHDLLSLLSREPRIAAQLDSATFVGDRRWDVRLKTGEVLALPEGAQAARALDRFAELDQKTQLLGRGFVRFDLRLPDKMVVRVGADTKLPEADAGVTI